MCDVAGDVGLSKRINTRRKGTRLLLSLGRLSTRTLIDMSTSHEGTWLPLWYETPTRPLGKRRIGDKMEDE